MSFLSKLEKGFEAVKEKLEHMDDDKKSQQQNNYESNQQQQQPQYGQQQQQQQYGQPQQNAYGSNPNQNVNGPFEVLHEGKPIPAERKNCRAGCKPLMLWTHGAGGGLNDDATQGFANGFAELTDAAEQRRRFEMEMAEKRRRYGHDYPLDEDFLQALPFMPPTRT